MDVWNYFVINSKYINSQRLHTGNNHYKCETLINSKKTLNAAVLLVSCMILKRYLEKGKSREIYSNVPY